MSEPMSITVKTLSWAIAAIMSEELDITFRYMGDASMDEDGTEYSHQYPEPFRTVDGGFVPFMIDVCVGYELITLYVYTPMSLSTGCRARLGIHHFEYYTEAQLRQLIRCARETIESWRGIPIVLSERKTGRGYHDNR